MRKLTINEFILRAKYKHNNLYGYSNTTYTNAKAKCLVTCYKHGDFLVSPDNHLKGKGCPKCIGRHKTTDDFVQQARLVHGAKYTYENTVYLTSNGKVNITCQKHGDFSIRPSNHLSGRGCPRCHRRYVDLESFISLATEVHNGFYDYSASKYLGSDIKITIRCPKHGYFEQTPHSHIAGSRCPKCAGLYNCDTDYFILVANGVHKNKYLYTCTVYTKAREKISIECPTHGIFRQAAHDHIIGKGCPACAKSGYDKLKPATFYIYEFANFIGFGISNNFYSRHKKHRSNFTKHGVEYVVVYMYHGGGSYIQNLERSVKEKFKHCIVDTGIPGFRKEALLHRERKNLLDFIEMCLQQEFLGV